MVQRPVSLKVQVPGIGLIKRSFMTLAMLLMAFSAGVLLTCICYVLGAPSERDSNMGLMSLFAVILAISRPMCMS